jgi:hypothetical protein
MVARALRWLVMLALAATAACAGPDPVVEHATVGPSPQPGCMRVTALVRNRGRGHGQIEVEVVLRDRAARRTIHADRELELEAHETVELSADIPAPPGSYDVVATAKYPH